MKISALKFKTFVVAHEVRPTPPLGPLLGQYGLNIVQFCDDLNRQTFVYQKGLVLPIVVVKSPVFPKGYSVVIKPPTISFLFSLINFDKEEAKFSDIGSNLDSVSLFDLVRIYSVLHSISFQEASKFLFSFLRSINGHVSVDV